MKKLNNKGFSLIEIIIAIAIFVVLIVPVIKQIATGMNISATSKQKQLASEYAEYIMEYFKSTPLDKIGKDDLFNGENKFYETTSGSAEKTATVGGTTITYIQRTFATSSSDPITIGGVDKEYFVTVSADTRDYAMEQIGYRRMTSSDPNDGSLTVATVDGIKYVEDSSLVGKQDPNKQNVAGLTNLDSSDVAIIAGSVANMDETASDAFFAAKAEALKKISEDKWLQLMYGSGQNDFQYDTVKKMTRISIKNEGTDDNPKYVVSCDLEYKDEPDSSNTTGITVSNLSYNVYTKSFSQSQVPEIFLMYNPCVYNGEYAIADYIVMDVDASIDEEVKLYMIQTADELPDKVKDVVDSNNIEFKNHNLIQSGITGTRENVKLKFNTCGDISKLKVYTNVDLTQVNDDTAFAAGDFAKLTGNSAPGAGFVKSLADDTEYEGRLYTLKVFLYDETTNQLVAEFHGTRGAD